MKLNRLLEITILLMNNNTITAKELAERFQVSTRTIYRDLDVLSSSGVPVYTNKGKGGGISLLEGFTLNNTLVSEQERESILLALKTLQATNYPEIDLILNKIGSVFKNVKISDWVDIDFTPWGSSPHEDNKFQEIKRAIIERKIICFHYVNNEGERTQRSVEPMQLIFKGFSWYLKGYCHLKEGFRVFRISRIKHVNVLEEVFSRRVLEEGDETEFYHFNKSLINIKLIFKPQVLSRVYDDFEYERIRKRQDGKIEVEALFPDDDWVYTYILSYGCSVEVAEPISIRDKVAKRLEDTLQQYRD